MNTFALNLFASFKSSKLFLTSGFKRLCFTCIPQGSCLLIFFLKETENSVALNLDHLKAINVATGSYLSEYFILQVWLTFVAF